MKLRVTTMTPVHIGSGNINQRYIYHKKGEFLDCYELEDILDNLRQYMRLDDFLNLRFDNQKAKEQILNVFRRNVHYDEIHPKYYLYDYGDDSKHNVSEQIKSLNRPYIPGSTIKGAIINAIYFYFLKQKINDAIEYIKKEKNVKNLFNYLYGNEFEEAMTLYSSSLICRDIYFNDQSLILCHSQRLNMNKGQDFYDYECIDYNKEVEGEFIFIDLIKKDLFQKRFPKYYKLFKPLFNIDNIFVTIRNYYNRVLNNDVEYFEECGKNLGINYPKVERNSDACILRIGNSTNYFFKTISLLFKEKDEKFYSKYFYLFAPTKLERRNFPKPETMPKTRTIFEFDGEYYLPGLIKIEKCK